MTVSSRPGSRVLLFVLLAGLLLAGILFGGKLAVEKIVQDYILENPEILPQAMENLARKESARQLSGIREQVEKPFPGAILGNPKGKVTLVEFTDFACVYCRQAVGDVDALIADHPDLRIVIRELPILSPESAEAARWGLAAAQQGKYGAFHRAMYAGGQLSAQTIEAAARVAGLDMARARAAIADPGIDAELKRNYSLAQQLGFSGTPSWVAGDQTLSGAVGKERLAKAIAEARGS